jgi:hypothetical protein
MGAGLTGLLFRRTYPGPVGFPWPCQAGGARYWRYPWKPELRGQLFIAGDTRGYRDLSWLAALGEGRVFCTRANYLVRYHYH